MKRLHSFAHRSGMLERALARPLLALFAAAWLGVFQGNAFAEDKRIVRLAWEGDPTTMDPAIWGTYPDQYLMDNVYPRLAKPAAGREGGYELDLASSVDFSDPLTIKFELKPGRMWNGGFGEVTAEDVKFTYERFLSPEMRDLTAFAALKEVEITGKYSGIIHLKEPAAPIWISSFTYVIGAILSKNAYEAAGNTIPIDTRATSGAYRIKEHLRGERMVLEKDPQWTGEQGDYDEIWMLPIEDENAALAAFAAGELDWIQISYQNAEAAAKNGIEGGYVDFRNSLDYIFLGVSMAHPSLADLRVRHAIQKGIDISQVVEAVWGDAIGPATGMAAPGLVGYRNAEPPARDVEGARALLAEAGAEGLSIHMNLPNYPETVTAAQVMQAQLAEVGVNVELLVKDDATFYDLTTATPEDRELTLQWWTGNPAPVYALQYFTEQEFEGWNWQHFHDDEFMELLGRVWDESDDAKRAELYVRMQEIMVESGAFVFVANPPLGYLIRDTVDPGMLPDGRPVFHAFKVAK